MFGLTPLRVLRVRFAGLAERRGTVSCGTASLNLRFAWTGLCAHPSLDHTHLLAPRP